MKKRTLITLILSSITLLGVIIFLCVGKVKKIEIEDLDNGTTTLSIVRGKLIGVGCSIKAPMDANIEDLMPKNSHSTLKYINENIVNKGYSNEQVVQEITNYMDSINGKVISVKNEGYVFSGLDWIIQRLSNMK